MNINIILIEHVIFFLISWIIEVFVFFLPGMFIFNLGYPVVTYVLFITKSGFSNCLEISSVCIVLQTICAFCFPVSEASAKINITCIFKSIFDDWLVVSFGIDTTIVYFTVIKFIGMLFLVEKLNAKFPGSKTLIGLK